MIYEVTINKVKKFLIEKNRKDMNTKRKIRKIVIKKYKKKSEKKEDL